MEHGVLMLHTVKKDIKKEMNKMSNNYEKNSEGKICRKGSIIAIRMKPSERNNILVRYITNQDKKNIHLHPNLMSDFILSDRFGKTDSDDIVHFGVGKMQKTNGIATGYAITSLSCNTGGTATEENGRATMSITKVTCGNCKNNIRKAAKQVVQN